MTKKAAMIWLFALAIAAAARAQGDALSASFGVEAPSLSAISSPIETPTPLAIDTAALPEEDFRVPSERFVAPFGLGTRYDAWRLHEGLNVSVGASVFSQFGKHARGGAGFAQSLAAVYAVPLTEKVAIAVGAYVNNVFFCHDSYRDAGISVVAGYRFDERWETYVYAHKSLVTSKMPPLLYDISGAGDCVGVAVRYDVNKTLTVEVAVENRWLPSNNAFRMSGIDTTRHIETPSAP